MPDGGLTASLARTLPRQLVMEMCVLARPVTSERLAAAGAINQIVPVGDTLSEAQALLDAIAAGPRTAQGVIKQLVTDAYEVSTATQLDAERNAMGKASGGDEAAEGIAAFLEKRKPSFS